jgi:hypothetical protein
VGSDGETLDKLVKKKFTGRETPRKPDLMVPSLLIFCNMSERRIDEVRGKIKENDIHVNYMTSMTDSNRFLTINEILFRIKRSEDVRRKLTRGKAPSVKGVKKP